MMMKVLMEHCSPLAKMMKRKKNGKPKIPLIHQCSMTLLMMLHVLLLFQLALVYSAGTPTYIADLPDYYDQTPIRLKRMMTVSLLTWLYHIHDGIARAIKRDQHRSPPPPTSTKEWSMNPLTGTVHLKWKHHQPVELVTHHKPSLSSLRREWLGNHQPIFIHAMLPFYRRSLSWLPFVQLFEDNELIFLENRCQQMEKDMARTIRYRRVRYYWQVWRYTTYNPRRGATPGHMICCCYGILDI
jgi:hypothetical protein